MTAGMTRQETLVEQALWLIERMRYGFAVVLAANVFAAITDVIGISLMLPAIQLVSLKDQAPSGLTAYFAKAFDAVGIDFTFSTILIVMVVVFLFKFGLVSSAGIIQSWLLVRMRESFRARIVRNMASANWAYITGQNQSRYVNLYVAEVDGVIAATKILVNFLSSFVFVAVFLCASFVASWRMTLLTIVMASVLFFPLSIVSRISKRLSTRLTAKNLSSYHFFGMMLGALKYLKATGTADSVVKLAEREIRLRGQTAFKMNTINVVTAAATEPIVVIFVCSFALIATTVFVQQPADIILPLLFLYRTGSRVLRMQRTGISFSSGAGSISALRSGLDEIAEAVKPRGGADPGSLSGAITLRSVGYRADASQILSDISLRIDAGAMIGLVGETGAGKTTLIDIISGLLMPTEGEITWNDRPYGELDLHRLRRRVGYVTQEPVVLNDTVLNNIALWEPNPDMSRVAQAAQSAHAMEFIERMPDGFKTMVGDRGQRLSGGQRQRLALARELYRDPELLIVDEGTSALDSETEDLIQESLAALKGRKTMIMIAHRLSTLRQCERIIVMNRGRITAQGTWTELCASGDGWLGRALRQQAGQAV